MSLVELAIGWLTPPQCVGCAAEGAWLCEACKATEILPHGERCGFCGALSPGSRTCLSCRPAAPSHVFISTDYLGLPQKLLRAYKYQHTRAIHAPLASLMTETFSYLNNFEGEFIVVPVPTATSRARQRGFDHSAQLARALAKELDLKYAPVLGRLGQSRQVGARRAERLAQAQGNYIVRRLDQVKSQNILLIDDVITTGGTLKAATKVLRAAGARRVDALVFAKRL